MSELTSRIDSVLTEKQMSRNAFFREMGIGDSTFRRWISGSSPSVDTVVKIAEVLEISLEWLVCGTNQPDLQLSFQEQKLLEVFRILNDNDKNAVLTLANGLSSQYSNTTTKNISIG